VLRSCYVSTHAEKVGACYGSLYAQVGWGFGGSCKFMYRFVAKVEAVHVVDSRLSMFSSLIFASPRIQRM